MNEMNFKVHKEEKGRQQSATRRWRGVMSWRTEDWRSRDATLIINLSFVLLMRIFQFSGGKWLVGDDGAITVIVELSSSSPQFW